MIVIDLSGKHALVTGGSGELGRVICRTLARAGSAVAVHYHRGEDRARRVVDDIAAAGGTALTVGGDITDGPTVKRIAGDLERAWGALPEIVVLNAVIQYQWTSILQQTPADFQRQFDSTVLQGVHLAQTFVPAMVAAGGGRFIAINTECALQCTENQGAYVAGKRGMDGLMRVLAREVGPHQVTVNQVAPGWMRSETRPQDHGEAYDQYRGRVPLRRRGVDQDIADAVVFLASDLAKFITGAIIPVCGGNVMPAI